MVILRLHVSVLGSLDRVRFSVASFFSLSISSQPSKLDNCFETSRERKLLENQLEKPRASMARPHPLTIQATSFLLMITSKSISRYHSKREGEDVTSIFLDGNAYLRE